MHAKRPIDRRSFLQTTTSAVAAAGLATVLDVGGNPASADEPAKKMKKAVKWGMVQTDGTVLDKFKLLKELGFDGVELDAPSNLNKDEVLRARDETGLPVHGVVDSAHWRDTLSHPDPAVRSNGVRALEEALRDAKHYGASTVLLVPAVVNKETAYADAYTRSQAHGNRI
jgi:hexulose-6-phosphate isomerase